jgi:hypothetical protein
MRFEQHCKKSKRLFEEDGALFHRWIDMFAADEGYAHRRILHTFKGMMLGIEIFGEAAGKHLEQHIRDDLQLKKKDELPIF